MNAFTSSFKDSDEAVKALSTLVRGSNLIEPRVQSLIDHGLFHVNKSGNFTPLRDLMLKTRGIGAIRGNAIESYVLAHAPNMKWGVTKNGDPTLMKKDKKVEIIGSVIAPTTDENGSRILWTAFKKVTEVSALNNVSDDQIAKRVAALTEKVDLTTGDKAIEVLASNIKNLEAQLDVLHAAHTALCLELNTAVDTDEPTVIDAVATA